jgi:hypothetical protein
MGCFTPVVSFQSVLPSDLGGCCSEPFEWILEPLDGNQQSKSHEIKNTVEKVKYDYSLTPVLEDPFEVLLKTINSLNIFEILRFKFVYNFSNELLLNRLWRKHLQSK